MDAVGLSAADQARVALASSCSCHYLVNRNDAAMMYVTTKQMRARILKTLPREMLDNLSERKAPWHSNRANIEAACLALWELDTKGRQPFTDEVMDFLDKRLSP